MTTKALTRTVRGDLTQYDPEKGLKTIAVIEAAEKHFARAKDATQLQKAIRAKLEAQAEFVTWWDTAADKARDGRPRNRNRSVTVLRLGKNGLPDKMVVSRWRRKLSDAETFEVTYQAALDRYVKILELDPSVHVAHNSGENEWYTPESIIEAARRVLGAIDLDPASSVVAQRVVNATSWLSRKDNGLEQPWAGRVWLNPPYAQPLVAKFADKLAASLTAGEVSAAVVLVNNATETDWFATIADLAVAICFPHGRVQFWNPKQATAAPLQGQAVLYAGPDRDRFCEVFQSFGAVWVRP